MPAKYREAPKRVFVFLGLHSEIVDIILPFRESLACFMKYEVCCVSFFMKYLTESCGLRKKRSDLWSEWIGDRLKFLFGPEFVVDWA